jgi:hypothetical protein
VELTRRLITTLHPFGFGLTCTYNNSKEFVVAIHTPGVIFFAGNKFVHEWPMKLLKW